MKTTCDWNTLFAEPRTAYEAAVRLIEPYVIRGDDPQWIKAGCLGAYCKNWGAQIGGYLYHGPLAHKKSFSSDKILVQRVNGEDCAEVFSFWEIYQLIKSSGVQPTLF